MRKVQDVFFFHMNDPIFIDWHGNMKAKILKLMLFLSFYFTKVTMSSRQLLEFFSAVNQNIRTEFGETKLSENGIANFNLYTALRFPGEWRKRKSIDLVWNSIVQLFSIAMF